MPADWTIEHWPPCGFHVFLSHVADDRELFVLPVLEKLQTLRVISWIDHHNYPSGRDSQEVLRESVLQCRHIVYFITPAMLKSGRGWTAIESAYGDLVQKNLSLHSTSLIQFELPLFLVPRSNPRLGRTPWRRFIDRGVYYAPGKKSGFLSNIDWAVQEIAGFVQREELRAEAIAGRLKTDAALKNRCSRDSNFANRLLAHTPRRVLPLT